MSDNTSTTIADEPVSTHNHASYRPPPEYGHANIPMMEPSSILDQLQLFPLPVPPLVTPRPITAEEKQRIDTLSELQFFLATAPTRWNQAETIPTTNLTKFQLPNGEYVSCVLWNGLYHITGTDIVRALSFRFEAFGRPVKATKKWEEGVFSDLRNLKPGLDASLEEPKSPLLDFLFRNGCIRTQKKQKVFYWFSVPHDRLFLDALERDLKREKVGQPPTTETVGEPARSFRYDPRRSLFEQFAGQNPGLSSSLLTPGLEFNPSASSSHTRPSPSMEEHHNMYGFGPSALASGAAMSDPGMSGPYGMSPMINSAVTFQRTLFEGSPAYKKRRVRSRQGTSPSVVEEHMRGQTPSRRSYSDMRSGTISPRMSHHVLRKVSGGDERGSSPLGLKRERDESVAPDYEFQQGEKLFVCAFEFCKRPFKRLEHLKRHVRTHTQERPYKCNRCTRSFSRQDNLSQHLRTHGRLEELPAGNNPGLGLGTPPPREGVDYFVATAGSGGQMTFDRWKTTSPAGEGYMMHHGMNTQPYRTSGSMPPPTLPYSSRSSMAPPDWNVNQSEPYGSGSELSYSDASVHGMRRYRSATPSSAPVYGQIAVPIHPMNSAPPMGWAPGPSHVPSPLAPQPIAAPAHPGPHHQGQPMMQAPHASPGGSGFSYSFWRPPSDVPYNVPPSAGSVMGSSTDSPVVGYDMPVAYPEQQPSGVENYPTPTASIE